MKEYKLKVNTRVIPADLETPVGIYLKVRDLFPQSALLESSDYHTTQNSVSLVGVDPIGSFEVSDGVVRCHYPDGSTTEQKGVDVIEALKEFLAAFKLEGLDKAPYDGLLGYTGYDCVKYFEKVDIQAKEEQFADVPEMKYNFYRFLLVVNHFNNEMTIVENVPEGQPERTDEIVAVLHNQNMAQYPFKALDDRESSSTDEQYMEMVAKGVKHCKRGDVFQIVPSRRFSQGFTGDEFNVYRQLRSINPSPYLFFFDFGGFKVFGSSPETHLRVQGDKAYIDPIAGTFKRTGDDARDKALAEELLRDEKENAEHVMLVDLARNDLSRGGGKVEIEFLKQIQFYSHVIHMVSRVKATLPEGADVLRLFANTFPAGTLSGAPKVRAMQLIDEMEPHSRLLYGGCIGYIGLNGDLNQAITIRSFLSHAGRLYSQAGAGVVARSIPSSELAETNNKLGALTRSLQPR